MGFQDDQKHYFSNNHRHIDIWTQYFPKHPAPIFLLCPLISHLVGKGAREIDLSVVVNVAANLNKNYFYLKFLNIFCLTTHQKFAGLFVQWISAELHRTGQDNLC